MFDHEIGYVSVLVTTGNEDIYKAMGFVERLNYLVGSGMTLKITANKINMKGERKMEKLLKTLMEVRPDVDFKNEKKLIDEEVLDSFDIIAIVNGINEAFEIEIDIDDLEPDNFNTIEAMYELICRLQNEE